MKNKFTAALLAFFLGSFGIHRFYLGQTGLGIGYALFCWTGLSGLMGVVDAILFVLMSEASFNAKYNSMYGMAAAGFVNNNVNNNTMSNNININNGTQETDLDKLEKLSRLRDSGAISEEEFQMKKSEIM